MAMNAAVFYGNEYIGIYARANDSIALLPKNSPPKFIDIVKHTLKIEPIQVSIDASNLIGIFTAMNNNGIVVPYLIDKEEVAILKKAGLNVYVSNDAATAVGNCIAVNDRGGIINPNISVAEKKKMEDALGVELTPLIIADHETVGAMCAATNKGFVIHNDIDDYTLEKANKIFKVSGVNATANMGSPYVGISVIANAHGAVVGMGSSGVEMQRIGEGLDVI